MVVLSASDRAVGEYAYAVRLQSRKITELLFVSTPRRVRVAVEMVASRVKHTAPSDMQSEAHKISPAATDKTALEHSLESTSAETPGLASETAVD